jgi:hypothetical protein
VDARRKDIPKEMGLEKPQSSLFQSARTFLDKSSEQSIGALRAPSF